MSAILSADDLNDFISPGVACIKPVETLPLQEPVPENAYEVTTEDKVAAQAPPAQITLTDCLACSGCVTSAEAMLVSLQSHAEVLSTLDAEPGLSVEELQRAASGRPNGISTGSLASHSGKVFVASVSPQVRASLAATYGTSEREAGYMIEQLLSGPQGIGVGGAHGNRFTWVLDTNAMRNVALVMEAEEVVKVRSGEKSTKSPVLTSACPGWICYAEKTHPHVLPHLSALKSPQALTGTLVKSILGAKLGVRPSQIWHLAIMPCFDKKLEASRKELTDVEWYESSHLEQDHIPVRDVDCVITAREILMLADDRGIGFPSLPREPVSQADRLPFPDSRVDSLLSHSLLLANGAGADVGRGTSGGFLRHVLATQQVLHPESTIQSERGRNSDVVEYTVSSGATVHFRAARYYGFRNIQNLVRKLRPPRPSRLPGGKTGIARKPAGAASKGEEKTYAYVEVMACPGGCTNGGGQIKLDDLGTLQAKERGTSNQKEWLTLVDEAYFSMDESNSTKSITPNHADEKKDGIKMEQIDRDDSVVDGISHRRVRDLIAHWVELTGISPNKLLYTTFNAVESDVGKVKGKEMEHVVELASKIGGGW